MPCLFGFFRFCAALPRGMEWDARTPLCSPCTACPDGLVSEVGATTCTLEPGFWRTSDSESALRLTTYGVIF